ncbi:rho GTPase-activating protein 11A isoform X2 [Pleurodeles waltl]|uniref:rho GTPase-activating protein 11A isoform X2 n=1 Tax=Pleurodeles waltl TaxID=8319 RepID=UPI0037096B43
MKPLTDYKSLLRLAVVQQLRGYGIKVKHWNSKQRLAPEEVRSVGTPDKGKTFGTPLHELPHAFVQDYGNIPSFVVAACKHLELHASTEGLFRKSGSVVRLKALKNQLDVGDACLAAAPPCDVAGLLKQFFRELPEPILRPDLHESFFKAQQLASEEERTAATLLLSCLMSDRTIDTLRFFFGFLQRVSLKSNENKMDSSNLAVIFAPNLLQSSDWSEKMSASTEKKLRLQAAVVRRLIDHAPDIGRIPDSILEKIPAMLGVDAGCPMSFLENYDDGELESPGERKRRRRRSVGVLSSMVTPVILTPSTKRKLPVDSGTGFSNKKRRSLKHNLGFDLLPSSLFSSGFTPSSAQSDASPSVSFETSQNSLSPFVISAKHLSGSGNLRSKKYENKKIHRVESGKTGCFSPKISRKEMVRRSLRLKFSLGKSSRENLVNSYPSTNGSESIGWRLATQQESEQKVELPKAAFSPVKATKRGAKIICKSEENLLTPKCSDSTNYRMSWTGPGQSEPPLRDPEGTPVMGTINPISFYSEPLLVVGKPPAFPCEPRPGPVSCKPDQMLMDSPLSGEEKHIAEKTLVMIKKAFSESGSDLHGLIMGSRSSLDREERPAETLAESAVGVATTVLQTILDITGVTDHVTPHANNPGQEKDSSDVKENGFSAKADPNMEKCVTEEPLGSPSLNSNEKPLSMAPPCQGCSSEDQASEAIKATTFQQSEVHDDANDGAQLTPCTLERNSMVSNVPVIAAPLNSPSGAQESEDAHPAKLCQLTSTASDATSKSLLPSKHVRVSDHIQRFNKLSLDDHQSKKVKSPLQFQRTPVRQSVRRINSLSEIKKQEASSILVKSGTLGAPLHKSASCDHTFFSRVEELVKNSAPPKPCPVAVRVRPASASLLQKSTSVRSQKSDSKAASKPAADTLLRSRYTGEPKVGLVTQSKTVLEDLTNHDTTKVAGRDTLDKKPRACKASAPAPDTGLARKLSGKEKSRFKGSPKNPITKAQLLPSSRPLEL